MSTLIEITFGIYTLLKYKYLNACKLTGKFKDVIKYFIIFTNHTSILNVSLRNNLIAFQ